MLGKFTIFAISLSCLIFYWADANQNHEAYERAAKKCASEVGVDPGSLRNMFQRGQNDPDRKYKCFLKCFMQEFGSMDNEGNILDHLDFYELPYQYVQIKDECLEEAATEDDICERAFSFHKCFMRKARDMERDY